MTSDELEPSPERGGRFVGTWLIDQPSHALYEYTFYTFGADGTLERGPMCDETGWVQRGVDSPLRCTFGDGWESHGDTALAIFGACSDGQDRTIELQFLTPPDANADGAAVQVTAVDGEPGWGHEWPSWRWQRCGGAQTCELACPSCCPPWPT